MSFVQNFPFFSIILSLVCAVISFAAGEKRARQLTVFLLTASVIMQASLLAYCARNHTSYAYMMGHYPAPWGNEITAGVLEPLMALLFAAVMLCSVVGGFTRILRDVAPRRRTLSWATRTTSSPGMFSSRSAPSRPARCCARATGGAVSSRRCGI